METEHSATQSMGRSLAQDGIRSLLEYLGEDPGREGLAKTPHRVVKAFREMTVGYDHDPKEILSTVFHEKHDQMVVLKGIKFISLCEHHMLPFTGEASVAYIPEDKVVGLSKLARLVECYAKRLQVQERMTMQITDALTEHLKPLGSGAIIKAHHSCMGCRGVRQPSAQMITSSLVGNMRTPEVRQEFLELAV